MNPQTFTHLASLTDATADETLGHVLDARNLINITAYVVGTGTINAGVITIEEADYDPDVTPGGYTGTWSAVTTVNAADVTGGAQKAVHLTSGSYGFLRPRVSTAIGGGGSVSVFLQGVA